MIRERDTIYIDEHAFKRSPKTSDLIKNKLWTIFVTERKLKRTTEEKERKRLRHIIDKANEEIEDLKINGVRHKHKYSTKKYKYETLKNLILEAIKNEKNNSICVENYAFRFKAKQGQVFTVFQELIREGVLSNKIRTYAHDTNRNPIFPMNVSGWAPNYYYIKNKE